MIFSWFQGIGRNLPQPTSIGGFKFDFMFEQREIELDSKECTLPTYIGRPWLSVLISWWQTWCGALLILLQNFKNYSCYECEPWMDNDIGTRYSENKHSINLNQISSMLYPVHKEKIAVVCQCQKTRYIHANPTKSSKTRKRFNWTISYRSVPTS